MKVQVHALTHLYCYEVLNLMCYDTLYTITIKAEFKNVVTTCRSMYIMCMYASRYSALYSKWLHDGM